MFLKRELRRKDGKEHVYYCLAETTRVGRDRVVQRRLLNLGELNTTQIGRLSAAHQSRPHGSRCPLASIRAATEVEAAFRALKSELAIRRSGTTSSAASRPIS